jgi:hypothetical protein
MRKKQVRLKTYGRHLCKQISRVVLLLLILSCCRNARVPLSFKAPLKIIVLTQNRTERLRDLLNSLEHTRYGGERVSLEIHIDRGFGQDGTIELAQQYTFSHGQKTIRLSSTTMGLAGAWLGAWTPTTSKDRAVIFEDDIVLSPYWYLWLKEAWRNYGALQDIAGVSLMRQNLVPRIPSRQGAIGEIKNDHLPFFYSLVGSIGFSPSPAVWKEFQIWLKANGGLEFDAEIPGLVTTSWWRSRRVIGHMWTQYFIYFCLNRNLFVLHTNLPRNETLAAHRRAQGVHFLQDMGQDYPVATDSELMAMFPHRPKSFTWDGSQLETDKPNMLSFDLELRILVRVLRNFTHSQGHVHVLVLTGKSLKQYLRCTQSSKDWYYMQQKVIILSTNTKSIREFVRKHPSVPVFWHFSQEQLHVLPFRGLSKLMCTGVHDKDVFSLHSSMEPVFANCTLLENIPMC